MSITALALGIAAATAIFSVVRGVVLRPLPYRDPESLVEVQEYQPAVERDQSTMSAVDYEELRAAAPEFAGFTAFSNSEFVLSDGNQAERVIGAAADEDLFPLLGVSPRMGRGFARGEVGASPASVVVLSHALWQRRYALDARVVGRSILLDGRRYTVIGVMPEQFEFPRNPSANRDIELWVPRRANPMMMMRRGMRSLTVIGRLRPGIAPRQVRSQLAAVGQRLAREDEATDGGWSLRAVPLREVVVGRVKPALRLLFACVAALLLVACINASTAALARVVARRQRLGVRLSLGATHRQLAALLFGESALLALLAGIVALPLSVVLRTQIMRLAPVSIPRQAGVHLDGATGVFTLALVLFVGAVTALAPALWLRRLDVRSLLSDGGRGASGSRETHRTLAALMVAQLALGTLLFSLTARLYAGYAELNRIDPGFSSAGVITATIALSGERYHSAPVRAALTEQLLERVRAIPGVGRAAITSLLPMSGGIMSAGYEVVGEAADSSTPAALRAVSGDFFETLGIPLRQGRVVGPADDERAPLVVVVNEALASQSFGRRSPIGALVRVTAPGQDSAQTFEVVGVVGNAAEKDLRAPASPILYFSNRQVSFPHAVLLVRSKAAVPVRALTGALHELDPTLALDDVGSLAAKVRGSYALQLFLLIVLAVFAVSGAVLIMVGVFGTVSYIVSAEARSIGVRLALGGTPGAILRSVLARSARLAVLGGAAGLAILLLTLRSLPVAGPTAAGGRLGPAVAGTLGIALVCVLASALPALRASRLDPATILRE